MHADVVYAQVVTALDRVRPALARKVERNRAIVFALIAQALEQHAAPTIDTRRVPLPVALKEMARLSSQLLQETHYDPRTGNMLKDDTGFSAADAPTMRAYLATLDALNDDVPLQVHYAAARVLQNYGRTQLGGSDVTAALVDSIRAEAAERGEVLDDEHRPHDPRKGTGFTGGGSYTWTPGSKTVRLSWRGYYTSDLAGLVRGQDFQLVRVGDGYAVDVPIARIDAVADRLDAKGYTGLAKALKGTSPTWRRAARVPQDAPRGTPQGAPQGAHFVAPRRPLDPVAGDMPGLRYQRPDPYNVLVALPFNEARALANDAEFDARDARERTDRGWIYWYMLPIEQIPLLAERLGGERADVLRRLHEIWSAEAGAALVSGVGDEDRRWAESLARRFLYLMRQPPPPEAVIARELLKSVERLRKVASGTFEVDLGVYGRWRVVGDIVDVSAGPAAHAALAKIAGTRVRSGIATVPVRRLPDVARALDDAGNFPLAASIRIALLTESVMPAVADVDCGVLEALSSARSLEEVSDPIARRAARQVLDRIDLPRGLSFRPFQQVGIAFAVLGKHRVLIGDAPGLGKTIQAIGAMLADPEGALPAVVVAPASVVLKWAAEIRKWAPDLRPIVVSGEVPAQVRPRDVLLLSWAVLDRHVGALVNRDLKLAVLDESHKAKHAKSQRSQAAAELAAAVPGLILLSGTALENTPQDLYHQLHLLSPEQYPDKKSFMERIGAGKRIVQTANGTMVFDDDRAATRLDELRDTLRCLMVRRLKTEVATDIPDKTRTTAVIELDPRERATYEKAEREITRLIAARRHDVAVDAAARLVLQGAKPAEAIAEVEAQPEKALNVLAELGMLRQVSGSLKIPYAIDWIQDHFDGGGGPLVAAAEHQEVVRALEVAAKKAKIRYGVLDGGTSLKERQRQIEAFQAGDLDLMIITRAAQEGVDLYAADTMLFIERQWVPAWEEQLEDRIHRIGQQRPVTIVQMMIPGTIDQQIADLIDEKRGVIHEVMGAERVGYGEGATLEDADRSIASVIAERIASRTEGAPKRITVKEVVARVRAIEAGER